MPKQTTDVSGNPFGIQYTANDQKWIVAKGVDVYGTTAGVYSTYANSHLVNQGDLTGGSLGIYFYIGAASSNSVIENKASGEIFGEFGIYIENLAGSLSITNDGEIGGSDFGIYATGSSAISLDNTGDISGGSFAVFLAASVAGSSGPVVNNHGKIESGEYGMYISGPSGVPAKITNHEGAQIKGGSAAILDLSQLNLKNLGKIVGDVQTSNYDDKIINKKVIKGDLLLGDGVDTFKNNGNKAKAGLIDTQDGNDVVVLARKSDKLLFDTALNAATNVDTIKKFASGKDKLYLDDDIFSTITPGTLSASQFHKGTAAADADDRIIYDKKSGALYYDPDGVGGLAQVQFAKFDGGPKLKASDFTVGEYSIVI